MPMTHGYNLKKTRSFYDAHTHFWTNTNYLILEGFYDKTFRNQSCLEFSSGYFGSKMKSVRPFWKILAFDHIWTWAWPPLWPWGS